MDQTTVAGALYVPVTDIRESAANPRSRFDLEALAELTASIASQGVIMPLLVRPVNGHYELVDGARRLRAAQAAGLDQVPVIVATREDEPAREAALVANLQRADVSPLDEARAFRTMARFAGAAPTDVVYVQHLARRVGKTAKYVWDRLKLLDLVPLAQELLDADRITVGHATLLARLDVAAQTRAIQEGLFEHEQALSLLDDDAPLDEPDELDELGRVPSAASFIGRKARTPRELEAWIASHIRFDVAAAAVAAPLDFGPVAERVAEAQELPGRGRKVVHVTYDHFVQPEAKTDGERTYCHNSWKRADGRDEDSPTCDKSVLGVIVVGPGYGQALPVCINKDCDIHWAAEKREREQRAKQATDPKAHKAREAREREERDRKAEQAREEQQRKEWAKAIPAIAAAVAGALKKAKPMTLAPELLKRLHNNEEYERYVAAPKTVDDVVRYLVFAEHFQAISNTYWGPREYGKTAKALGVDVAAIVQAANAEAGSKTSPKKNAAKAVAAKKGKKR